MASIRKRGSSYLLVVSMGYDYEGNRIRPKQKTVHPPEGLTPKQRENWLKEQAVLFERECRSLPQEEVDRSITLAKYTELWLQSIAPGKLADFIVIDADPYQVPPEKLKDIQVLETYLGGENTYCK